MYTRQHRIIHEKHERGQDWYWVQYRELQDKFLKTYSDWKFLTYTDDEGVESRHKYTSLDRALWVIHDIRGIRPCSVVWQEA